MPVFLRDASRAMLPGKPFSPLIFLRGNIFVTDFLKQPINFYFLR